MRAILADGGRQTPAGMVCPYGLNQKHENGLNHVQTWFNPNCTHMVSQCGLNHIFEVVYRGGLCGWFKPKY